MTNFIKMLRYPADPNKSFIKLSCMSDIGLIVSCPSGALYSNQAGGQHTNHPFAEGLYVPLISYAEDNGAAYAELTEFFFKGPKWRGRCTHGKMDEDTVVFLNAFFDRRLVTKNLKMRVDRGHIADSEEAWVYVTLEPPAGKDALFTIASDRGVLVWRNSD